MPMYSYYPTPRFLVLLISFILLSHPTPTQSTTYLSIRTPQYTYTLLDTRRSTTGNNNNDVIDTKTQAESDLMLVREQSSPNGPLQTSIIIVGSGNVLSKHHLLNDLTSIYRVRNLRTSYHTSNYNVSTPHADDDDLSYDNLCSDDEGVGFWEHVISRLLYVRNRQPTSSTSSSLSPHQSLSRTSPSHTTTPYYYSTKTPTTSTSLYPNLPNHPYHISSCILITPKKTTTFDSVGSPSSSQTISSGGTCMAGMVSKFSTLLNQKTNSSIMLKYKNDEREFERMIVKG
eukprot:CAMPEP_0118641728 /NCGR_PEP_ID=MMETSP0785-20121206/5455_1 /TAXON_ID=91992 /ORGANISM="Bolidomonas pacifica, Strain CCMP 1866" /LENGTH=286 /DNA_ID=CAMNT_0006533229 /DNA_START=70 /DNA_END=926 /DNA_ORIENTATION=+